MIDIHNHIIPGVDDGPKTDDEMMELIKQAREEGITEIVATPHHLHYRYNNEYQDVLREVNRLNEKKEIIDLGIKIYPGQEIRINDRIFDDLCSGKISGINNSMYLLIELPSNEVPVFTQRVFFELQRKGFIPIIAHPERNKAIAQDINILFELVNQGALSQITVSSLLGIHGKNIKKLCELLISHHLAHFIASDAHHSIQRPFLISSLMKDKTLTSYEKEIKTMLDNGNHVINNKNITKNKPKQHVKRKFLGLF